MSLCEHSCRVCMCPVTLVSWICCEHKSSPSQVCWQLSPWEDEGLRPEPGIRQGFPSVQWPSLPQWGQNPGPTLPEKEARGSGRELVSFIYVCALPPAPLPQSSAGAEETGVGIQWGLVHGLWWSGCCSRSILPLMLS